jgi:hypothetical protein
MAPFIAHGSLMLFILPLEDDGYIGVLEILLGLRFTPLEGIMYVKQGTCYMRMKILFKKKLMQKNKREDDCI